MLTLKSQLQAALTEALARFGVEGVEVVVQEVPADKPGDYGSPVAFSLARQLRQSPAVIAQQLLASIELPAGIAKAEAVGPYLNFFVEPGAFVRAVIEGAPALPKPGKKVIVEHTSINPNKEAHVGHLRNIALGDAIARILRAAGYAVEVQNYIDDTGRQAAESLFAIDYFQARYDGSRKYDHWLGELYVRLQQAKATDGEAIEAGVRRMMQRLEHGELREAVATVVRALLETSYRLGVHYDLLVWESDVVQSGFLAQGLALLKQSPLVMSPSEGKYAGALVMDVSSFIPGLEEPYVVLVRSDGSAVYVAKDIGYHFWKAGRFAGLTFERFDVQPDGTPLYSSSPAGEPHPDGRSFAGGDLLINVIDVRQSHPQQIVRAALQLAGGRAPELHHLAYEVVTLEGQPMSGRKGITLAIDAVIDEAIARAKAKIRESNPELADIDAVAEQVGIGALRFAMLKSEAKRVIDFRWEQALSLQGDSAPYVQYAHARASRILQMAAAQGVTTAGADFGQLGALEVKLAQLIARYPEVLQVAAQQLAPHLVAQYCLDLATAWNAYYNHKDAEGRPDTRVLQSPPGLREARLALVAKLKATLADSLALLGIAAPEQM